MPELFPSWLKSLNPSREPQLERLSEYSAQLAWYVDIQLRASFVPPDGILTGSETWNGKALVAGASPTLERSVGEVEVTQRHRPATIDEISVEQDAWFRAALEQGRLHIDRYAVVRWIPSPEDRAKLLQHSRASAAGRLARLSVIGSGPQASVEI